MLHFPRVSFFSFSLLFSRFSPRTRDFDICTLFFVYKQRSLEQTQTLPCCLIRVVCPCRSFEMHGARWLLTQMRSDGLPRPEGTPWSSGWPFFLCVGLIASGACRAGFWKALKISVCFVASLCAMFVLWTHLDRRKPPRFCECSTDVFVVASKDSPSEIANVELKKKQQKNEGRISSSLCNFQKY